MNCGCGRDARLDLYLGRIGKMPVGALHINIGETPDESGAERIVTVPSFPFHEEWSLWFAKLQARKPPIKNSWGI